MECSNYHFTYVHLGLYSVAQNFTFPKELKIISCHQKQLIISNDILKEHISLQTM